MICGLIYGSPTGVPVEVTADEVFAYEGGKVVVMSGGKVKLATASDSPIYGWLGIGGYLAGSYYKAQSGDKRICYRSTEAVFAIPLKSGLSSSDFTVGSAYDIAIEGSGTSTKQVLNNTKNVKPLILVGFLGSYALVSLNPELLA